MLCADKMSLPLSESLYKPSGVLLYQRHVYNAKLTTPN